MATGKKLINKIKRREAYANRYLARFKDFANKRDELMAKNPKIHNLFRKIRHAFDSAFGIGFLPAPDKLKQEKLLLINDLDRFDFGTSDFGIRLQVDDAAVLAAIGLNVGDILEILTDANKGKQYEVVELVDATTIRLEDDANFGSAETDVYAKAKLSGVKRSFE